MDARKTIAKHRRDTAKALANPNLDLRPQAMKIILKEVASGAPHSCVGAAIGLDTLAIGAGRLGMVAVLEGRPEGWAELQRVLYYHHCRIEVHPSSLSIADSAAVLLNSIAFGETEMSMRLAAIIREAHSDPRIFGWAENALPGFGTRLWGLAVGREMMTVHPDTPREPVLERIFSVWNDADAFTEALAGLCDWHLRESLESSGPYPAFLRPPYELLPIDVLAVVRVRELLGLPVVLPNHPLLDLPLAHPPRDWATFTDEPLELVRACNARLPDPETDRYRRAIERETLR